MLNDEVDALKRANPENPNRITNPPAQKPVSEKPQHSLTKRIILLVILVALLIGIPWLFRDSFNNSDRKVKKDAAAPITVTTAVQGVIPIEIRSIGNVLPYSVINVVPQVGGQLSKVTFTQGQYVKTGDLLFEIDPSPYKAALDQAEGNVAKDKAQIEQAQANLARDKAQVGQLRANKAKDEAQLKYATTEMGRYVTLQQEGAVSTEQRDQMDTNQYSAKATIDADEKAIENAQATVNADKAAIDTAKGTLEADTAAAQNARIQLSWCTIRSAIDGRTSSLNVYQGNVVTANASTPLVTIDQVKPIYVTFTVPEQYLDEVRKNLAHHTLMVQVQVEGVKKNAVEGAVSFLENTVNTQTGTVVLRAAFANTDLRLFPGQFVDVIVTMPPDGNTVVIPVTALQTTQQGTAVYILKPDNTVSFSPVEVERTSHDQAAIASGVAAGDIVVTDGQLQLVPGAKVNVVQKAAPNQTESMPANAGSLGDSTLDSTNAGLNAQSGSTNAAPNVPSNPSSLPTAGPRPISGVSGAEVNGALGTGQHQHGHVRERLEAGPPIYKIRGNARTAGDGTKETGQPAPANQSL